MADPPPADSAADANGDEVEPPQPPPEVPEKLSLPIFFPNEFLSDCTIRLPKEKTAEGEEGEKKEGEADGEEKKEGRADEEKKDGENADANADSNAGDADDPNKPKTSWKCHKVVLCSASDFFYEKFIIKPLTGKGGKGDNAGDGADAANPDAAADGGADKPAGDGAGGDGAEGGDNGVNVNDITIPSPPDDLIVKEEINLEKAVPLCLRYCYSNQNWEDLIENELIEDATSLFVAAALLKIKSLISHLLTYIKENVLSLQTCASLFYHATLLGPSKGELLAKMARDFILTEYNNLNNDDYALLSRLPMETILPLLQDDELNIDAEVQVYELVNRVIRSRYEPREEQSLTLSNLKLTDATSFVNQPVLWELVVCESGEASIPLDGKFFAPETEKYSTRNTVRLNIEPGTKGEYSFPPPEEGGAYGGENKEGGGDGDANAGEGDKDKGNADGNNIPKQPKGAQPLVLRLPKFYNSNVSALQAPGILVRAIKEIQPFEGENGKEVSLIIQPFEGGENGKEPTPSSQIPKPDPRLRWEVVAEGFLPRECYVDEPVSPSLRKRAGLQAKDPVTPAKKAVKKKGADEAGDGGGDAGGNENPDAAKEEEAEEEELISYMVNLKFKGESRGELIFNRKLVDIKRVDPNAEKGDGEDGEKKEGEDGAADGAGEKKEGEEEKPDGDVNKESEEEEFDPNYEPPVVAALPIDDLDVDALIDCVRFPFLEHQELVDASRNPILHEVQYQHLVVEALSNRLAAYEPGKYGENEYEVQPRTALIRQAEKNQSSGKGKKDLDKSNKSPLKKNPLNKDNDNDNQPKAGLATIESPIIFSHLQDFDDSGILHFLSTNGKEKSWKNPQGLGQIRVLTSGVGFGKSEDLVGRDIVNLRTGNEENSFFGIDLMKDRLVLCEGYCLRGRNATSHALINFAFQGSRGPEPDGTYRWVTLDEQSNETAFRIRPGITAYYDVNLEKGSSVTIPGMSNRARQNAKKADVDENGVPNKAFRCFRVVQIGKNSSGSYNLGLSGIEIYGKCIRGSFP